MKPKTGAEERGSLMLDGMIVMLMTIMLLVFLMAFGFLLYQQWLVQNVANDTATRIAQSYSFPHSNMISGDIELDDVIEAIDLSDREKKNQQIARGIEHGERTLKVSALAYAVEPPVVDVRVKEDGMASKHIEVEISAKYEIPFGGALEFFGLREAVDYHAVGYAEVIDLTGYIGAVDTGLAIPKIIGEELDSKLLKTVNSVLGTIGKMVD